MAARWKLTAPHYLPIEGTEWIHEETSRDTGKRLRKVFAVPLHLDPENPSDQNDRENGWVIVANEFDRAHPRDYIFIGPPTPDMEPLNDEAEAITEAAKKNWVHPIDSLPGQGYGQSLLAEFEKQLAQAIANAGGAIPKAVSLAPADTDRLARIEEQLAQLMARNAELEAALAQKSERRV